MSSNSSFYVDAPASTVASVAPPAPAGFYADPQAANNAAAQAALSATSAANSATNAAASVQASAGTATPLVDGTAAVGTSTKWAHEDHVHPTDATRAPLASPALTGTPSAPTASAYDSSTKLATTAYVDAKEGSATPLVDGAAAVGASHLFARQDHVHPTDTTRAPLASPALTGTPTAPTPTVGDNSTKLATTAYVDAKVGTATPLIDGTAAVGTSAKWAHEDHVHPTDTTRAPLASPALTGTPTAPTATVGTNTTQLATTAFVLANGASKLPTRFWQGFQHSNNVTTPNTKVDIGAGSARDSTDAIDIVVSAGTIDCGTVGANGLDAGSLAASTWYYTFAITTAGGTTAFLASTSPTAPTLPATYTKFRRAGAFKTNGSSQIIAFKHVNNKWSWLPSAIPRDVSAAPTNGTNVTAPISVPRVLGVVARVSVTAFPGTAVAATIYVYPGFFTLASGVTGGIMTYNTTQGATIITEVQVDSSAQVSYFVQAASGTHTVVLDTLGWQDDL